jgi:phosphate transport system protein
MGTLRATRYEAEMEALRGAILQMGGAVEEMLGCVIEALSSHDASLARRARAMDEQVDQLEKDIDELCLRVLALHQPAAWDLRFVTMSMKLVTDLERMGDLVGNIADGIIELSGQERLAPYVDLPRMATLTRGMINRALDAFVGRDAELAMQVLEDDAAVDELHWKIRRELIALMSQDGARVPRAILLFLITRHLERLGDHATNIAEEVIFLVRGRDVRHLPDP